MKSYACPKVFMIFLVSFVVLLFVSLTAWPKYPDRPITFIMGWPAGGGTDISGRPLITAASRILGQPIVIEYHPGGSSAVSLGMLKTRKADGYTIGHASVSSLINQHTRKVPYDILKDFTLIMQYAGLNYGLAVLADSPWKTLKEFLDYAKANPGKIRFSSSGPGTPQALVMISLAKHLQIKWTHIPFEGGPAALTALLGGHVEALTCTGHPKPHIVAGRLRLLCVYGEKRNPSFPNVPTLEELGIPIVAPNIYGVIGPKGLSSEIVEPLHQAFKKAMEDPDFIKGCENADHFPIYRNPQEMTKHLQKLDEEIGGLIRELKLRKE